MAEKIKKELEEKTINDAIMKQAEKTVKVSKLVNKRGEVESEIKKVSKPG